MPKLDRMHRWNIATESQKWNKIILFRHRIKQMENSKTMRSAIRDQKQTNNKDIKAIQCTHESTDIVVFSHYEANFTRVSCLEIISLRFCLHFPHWLTEFGIGSVNFICIHRVCARAINCILSVALFVKNVC